MPSSTMHWPKVTVLIPAYNLAGYLDDAVRSVLAQTYGGPLSIIVLDDGSSDGTLACAEELARQYPQIQVLTQSNLGRVATRNRLLSLATTEFVAWLDGDDMATPNWLHDQVSELAADDILAAVSGQGYSMNADNYPIGPIDAHPLTHTAIHEQHLAGKSNAFFQSCVVVKKSMVQQAGGYRTDYPAAEDYDLWLRLAAVGQLRNLAACHLIYRVHGTSANATISVQQRLQGRQSVNEARSRLGMAALPPAVDDIPEARKDDWNRRVYFINIALKSGNPRTALLLAKPALYAFPTSLLVWCMFLVAVADCLWIRGNRTSRFRLGQPWYFGSLPRFCCYRGARALLSLSRRNSSR